MSDLLRKGADLARDLQWLKHLAPTHPDGVRNLPFGKPRFLFCIAIVICFVHSTVSGIINSFVNAVISARKGRFSDLLGSGGKWIPDFNIIEQAILTVMMIKLLHRLLWVHRTVLINSEINIQVDCVGKLIGRLILQLTLHSFVKVHGLHSLSVILKFVDDLLAFVDSSSHVILITVAHDLEGVAVWIRLKQFADLFPELRWRHMVC